MGIHIARAALAAGNAVVATGRNIDTVTRAVGKADDLQVVKLDITSPEDAEAAVKVAVDRFGGIDVLVNNAGNFYAGFFEEITPQDFRAQVETLLFGPLNVTRAVLPVMRTQRSGVIVTISSTAGIRGGEFLTAGPGWRWVMFVNVLIGIAAFIFTPILIDESRAQLKDRRLDVLGAVTVTAGLIALVYALTQGNVVGWFTLQTLGLVVLAVVLLVTFVSIELSSPFPLVRLGIFRIRTVTGANLVTLIAPGIFGSIVFVLTLYMQKVLGYSALLTGLAFLPLAGMVLVTSNIASRLVARLGVKPFLVGGMIVLVIGILLLTGLSPSGTFVGTLLPGMLVVVLGIGPVFATIVIAATAGVSNDEQGLASGLFNTTLQVGTGLCLAIVSAISQARTASLGANGGLFALTDGFRYALYLCVGFAVLGIFAALFGIHEHIDRTNRQKKTLKPTIENTEMSAMANNV